MNKNESFDFLEAGRWPVSETSLAQSEKGVFQGADHRCERGFTDGGEDTRDGEGRGEWLKGNGFETWFPI